ncbi:hypothetical protein PMAYCL1PPCAC_05093, partial [Pristionchus mayeri]
LILSLLIFTLVATGYGKWELPCDKACSGLEKAAAVRDCCRNRGYAGGLCKLREMRERYYRWADCE